MGEGLLWLWHLSSQETVKCDKALLSSKWLNICLPMWNSEQIPLFALLVHIAFAFPIKLSLSQPVSLFAFYFLSALLGQSEWLGGWTFGCWPGVTHHTWTLTDSTRDLYLGMQLGLLLFTLQDSVVSE